jgi:hypothetical protein
MKLKIVVLILFLLVSCSERKEEMEKQDIETEQSSTLVDFKNEFIKENNLSGEDLKRFNKGVEQLETLWNADDGKGTQLEEFIKTNFIKNGDELDTLFNRLQRNYEIIDGHFNKMMLDLKMPVALDWAEITPIDRKFDSFNPSSHLEQDLYNNKIAFITVLNFPFYSLEEKRKYSDKWTRKNWAYARMGDRFTSRVPAKLLQNFSKVNSEADAYIYEYYIYMGNIVNNDGESLFPEDMKLISHWNLRDELKSQYANDKNGQEKQDLIYAIMQRIITQEIPKSFINSNEYKWNPITNKLYKQGKEIEYESEPNTRYDKILEQFKVLSIIDDYSPEMHTYIERKFSGEMEMSIDEVEKLFTDFVSSPVIKKAGDLIKNRLGRDLQPYDIWYDGFKSRSSINEEQLDKITKRKYPDASSVKRDLPIVLKKLGWDNVRANYIADKVEVDPSRGAGHAWGAEMRGVAARLRTRIAEDGMDYKGYNIAVHEFGHNVEQVLSLYDIDYYMLNGVPNTAFTEALAFVFQMRDLKLLGMESNDKNSTYLYALDNLWSTFEIMGASLVDQKTWKWLYENPTATPEDLKNAVNKISKEVWNKYYAPVIGVEDSNILGIYSHMISYPLYLSAYPIGHLIEFQIEEYIKDKNLGTEFERMSKIGKVLPNTWMIEATGNKISPEPLLNQAEKALIELSK